MRASPALVAHTHWTRAHKGRPPKIVSPVAGLIALTMAYIDRHAADCEWHYDLDLDVYLFNFQLERQASDLILQLRNKTEPYNAYMLRRQMQKQVVFEMPRCKICNEAERHHSTGKERWCPLNHTTYSVPLVKLIRPVRSFALSPK